MGSERVVRRVQPDEVVEETAQRRRQSASTPLPAPPTTGAPQLRGPIHTRVGRASASMAVPPTAATVAPPKRVQRSATVMRRMVDTATEDRFLADAADARRTTPRRFAADERAGTDARLESSLIATGRAGGTVEGRTQQERAEDSAAEVLGQLERGTQQNQALTDPSAPQTHAVSGHGPGTDQMGRLLHGRRADEVAADQAAGRPTDYTTVGENPSNTSGAFTSAQGMLHAVTEGFAQANMVSAHAAEVERDDRSRGDESSTRIDSGRFVTNVTGRSEGESLGYNLSVDGVHGQTTGFGLASDEVAERSARIRRDDRLGQARIVLDPAYVDGRRAGWNLQTAYANSDPATAQFATPAAAGASRDVLEMTAAARAKDVATAERALEDAHKALEDHRGDLLLARQSVERIEQILQTAPRPNERTREETVARLSEIDDELETAQGSGGSFGLFDEAPDEAQEDEVDDVDEAEVERLEALKAAYVAYVKYWDNQARLGSERERVTRMEQNEAGLVAAVDAARDRLASAREGSAHAAEVSARAQPPRGPAIDPDDGGGGALGSSGYNPATGLWAGERPAKPAELRGTDESGDSLTAHHLYPWNKIRDDLNRALGARDRSALEELLTFGSATVDEAFWTELARDPADRPYSFTEQLNVAVRKICWTPANVFMGPLGSKRGDDPGEELDQAYTKSGLMTPASAVAELIAASSGLGASSEQVEADTTAKYLAKVGAQAESDLSQKQRAELVTKCEIAEGRRKLAVMLAERTREAQDGSARNYDPAEWATDAAGKRVRAGRVASPHVVEVAPELVAQRDALTAIRAESASVEREIEQLLEQLDEIIEQLGGSPR